MSMKTLNLPQNNHLDQFKNFPTSPSPTTISRCGYLFLSPSNSSSKRWQRRWFILSVDGVLSYSLDEDPETIPQGMIDMKDQVESVVDADQETGVSNSIGIRLHNHHTSLYVQTTSSKEKKWWLEVLSRFGRSSQRTNGNIISSSKEGMIPFKENKYNNVKSNKNNSNSNGNNILNNQERMTMIKRINFDNNNYHDQLWPYFHHHLHHHNHHKSSTPDKRTSLMTESNSDLQGSSSDVKTINLTSRPSTVHEKLQVMTRQVKKLQEELKESYANYDYLEIAYERMKQRAALRDRERQAELELLRSRVNDLTAKLTIAQKTLMTSATNLKESSSKTINSDDRINNLSLLNRLQDLSSSVQKISDSLHVFCDTSRPLVRTQSDP